MFLASDTLHGVYAYLSGYDAANGCLTGFREWLIPRVAGGNSLSWCGLVDIILCDDDFTERERISELGNLLAEFYMETREYNGTRCDLKGIYLRYHAWLLNQIWYKPDLPGYVAPYNAVRDPPEDSPGENVG